jgi:hypothetical protein
MGRPEILMIYFGGILKKCSLYTKTFQHLYPLYINVCSQHTWTWIHTCNIQDNSYIPPELPNLAAQQPRMTQQKGAYKYVENLSKLVIRAVAYLQFSPIGGSCDEKWHGQGKRKHSVSWNLPKLSQLWQCNRGFRPCTTQNHLQTKQFMSGTLNSSRVAAYALKWTGRPRPLAETVEHARNLSGALRGWTYRAPVR